MKVWGCKLCPIVISKLLRVSLKEHSYHVSWAAHQPALCTNSSEHSPYRWIHRINKVSSCKRHSCQHRKENTSQGSNCSFQQQPHLDESSCLWNHTLKFAIPQRNSVLQTSHVSTITHQDLGGGKLCVNPCPVMHSYGYFSEVIYSFWRSSAKASVIKQLWTWSFSLHLKNRKGHKPGSKLSFLQASSTAGQVVLQHRKTLFLHLATFFQHQNGEIKSKADFRIQDSNKMHNS